MRKIKAVFLDFDGTIVSIKKHIIPDSAIDAIDRIRRKGVFVFLCTSRAKQFLPDIHSLHFDGYVCLTGAHCIDSEKRNISTCPIHYNDVAAVVNWAQKSEKPLFGISDNSLYVLNPQNPAINDVLSLGGLNLDSIGEYSFFPDFLSSIDSELLAKKIGILQLTSYIKLQEEDFLMNIMPHSHTERWHPSFTDIVSKDISKASGIDIMASHFGFSVDETMAVGDGGNDISMIRHAAVGVAMGNSADEVKMSADFVTDDVDLDGLKKALDRYV